MADKHPHEKPILCLDFDGVIHSYTSGWKGANVVPDPPVPGAIAFLKEAVKYFKVNIFSTRSHQKGGVEAMMDWLLHHAQQEGDTEWLNGGKITFPYAKPPALVTIDDRAITFTGTWPDMETLLNFKPWNKK